MTASFDTGRAIFVLGMHRSGTSALTRLLNLLGAELGSPLLPPGPGNETGFWEHADIVRTHDALLKALDRGWDSVASLPEGWASDPAAAAAREALGAILARNFANAPLWAVKDPRQSRLLDLWKPLFEKGSAPPRFVLVNRHPFEIARSLETREGLGRDRAILLWLRHVLEAERGSRTYPRIFVGYPSVLRDWRGVAGRIAAELGLSWSRAPEDVAGEVGRFLDPGRRHHVAAEEPPASALEALALDVHGLLDAANDGGPLDTGRLDALHEELSRQQGVFDAVLFDLEARSTVLADLLRRDENALKAATQVPTAPEGRESALHARLFAATEAAHAATFRAEQAEEARKATEKARQETEEALHATEKARAGLAGQLADTRHELEKAKLGIESLERVVADRDRHIGTLNQHIAALGQQIAALDQQANSLRSTIDAILSSTSWRITRPVRAIRHLMDRTEARIGLRRLPSTLRVETFVDAEDRPQARWVATPTRPLPGGWILIRALFRARRASGSLHVRLVDVTDRVHHRILTWQDNRPATDMLCLPAEIVRFEIESTRSEPGGSLDRFDLFRIGSGLVAARYAARHATRLRQDPKQAARLVGRALSLAREGQFRTIADRLFERRTTGPRNGDYQDWIAHHDTLTAADWDAIRARIEGMAERPRISVVMPVYDTPEPLLRAAIESVRRQAYPNWELCIADDKSPAGHVRPLLEAYAAEDDRIKVAFRDSNGGISAASNSALELATGRFVAMLDHDDLLREHALYMLAEWILQYPDKDVFYSDEDKIDDDGARFDAYFKPEWNRDLFYGQNYLNHLTAIRTDLVREAGGWRSDFDGSQDYDLLLRVLERTTDDRIAHIPFILYHWRATAGSTALAIGEKSSAPMAARRALAEHFARIGSKAEVLPGWQGVFQRVRWPLPAPLPRVTLIIPTRDRVDLLRNCVEGLRHRTDYDNLEILIVDNDSVEPETLAYFESLSADPRVRVLPWRHPYNYAELNNFAAREASGEILGLVNNDIEIIHPDWLKEMVSHAVRPKVGAVGALLYYGHDAIQHAGIVTGIGGVAGHSHKHMPRPEGGYFGRAKLTQEVSGVTAACMLVRRSVFEELDGLDAEKLAVAFNDVDFCLRLRERGYKIIYTPHAELYHLESASRGSDETPERRPRFQKEVGYMLQRWGEILDRDPFYSPNLTLEHEDFSIAFPPRAAKPWFEGHRTPR